MFAGFVYTCLMGVPTCSYSCLAQTTCIADCHVHM